MKLFWHLEPVLELGRLLQCFFCIIWEGTLVCLLHTCIHLGRQCGSVVTNTGLAPDRTCVLAQVYFSNYIIFG